jgi:Tfp pilus assembly pilus retraction ATPase PilT
LATLHTRGAASAIDRIVGAFPPAERELVRGSLAASLAAVVCQRLLPRAGGGRVAVAAEVLVATPAVRNLIRESRSSQLESVMQTGQAFGMQGPCRPSERGSCSRCRWQRNAEAALPRASAPAPGDLPDLRGGAGRG